MFERQWNPLHGYQDRLGYWSVTLSAGPVHKRYNIHRLVLEAFVGHRPDGMECRHLDGHASNSKLSNICWGTPSENAKDKIRHGTSVMCLRPDLYPRLQGEDHPKSKLTNADVFAIKQSLRHETQTVIARRYSVSKMTISFIARGLTWKHLNHFTEIP
jgi:hypothetical protein